MPWRREWQPTLVFLPGESHGERSLTGYSTWGHKELDTTEQLTLSLSLHRRHGQICDKAMYNKILFIESSWWMCECFTIKLNLCSCLKPFTWEKSIASNLKVYPQGNGLSNGSASTNLEHQSYLKKEKDKCLCTGRKDSPRYNFEVK